MDWYAGRLVSARFHRNQEVSVQPRNRFSRSVRERRKDWLVIRDNYYPRGHLESVSYRISRLSWPIEIYRQLNKGTITASIQTTRTIISLNFSQRIGYVFFLSLSLLRDYHVTNFLSSLKTRYLARPIVDRILLVEYRTDRTREEDRRVVESEISIAERISVAHNE